MTARLLDDLATSPFLRVERRGARAGLYVRDKAIGALDLRSGWLTIDVDRDLAGPLLDRHPQRQATAGGVRLRATGAGRTPRRSSGGAWRSSGSRPSSAPPRPDRRQTSVT